MKIDFSELSAILGYAWGLLGTGFGVAVFMSVIRSPQPAWEKLQRESMRSLSWPDEPLNPRDLHNVSGAQAVR